jgi:integration host factor subunit beta
MTRSKLISLLADKNPKLTASDVVLAVNTVIDSIGNHLVKGGRIEIRGFGSFSSYTRPPRLGRNPMTGEIVPVPEKRVPHFKAGIELRERVNVEEVEQRDVLKKIV